MYRKDVEYAYPIPTLGRDKALSVIHPYLEERGIYSRGRFGAWRYEVGNMDHSVMQGIEAVDRILLRKRGNRMERRLILFNIEFEKRFRPIE